ncbi:MAG: fibronectin type III domain-containing protein [Gemmatimonadetes bacterium]|nr:fibronectin type III domain-containing protein [Candidatus Palauibacter rhopaloidicola]
MIRNRLGPLARFLMVATAVAWWVPSGAAAVTAPVQNTVPAAPQNLTVRPLSNAIFLLWDPVSDATGYQVQASANGSTGWITIAKPKTNQYTYHGQEPGTTRFYQVAALNAADKPGAYSNVVSITTTGSTSTPSEPLNLSATIAASIATLTWNKPTRDGGSPITSYQIHLSADDRHWEPVAEPPATATGHVGLVTPGVVSTTFRVRAVNANGAGIPAFVTVPTGGTGTPSVPLNLSAIAAGPTIIDLDWGTPALTGASAIIDYQVEWSTTGGVPWTLLTTTGQTSFRDASLTAGATRYYRVRARNANGFGPWTSPEHATTPAATPPGPPLDLRATADGSSAIDLSWSEPASTGSSEIIGYRIEASSTRFGGWENLVANTGNTRRTYRDTEALGPNTTRYYRVAAISAAGTSVWSNVADATTERGVPDAPGRLTAQARGISVIELRWTRPSSSGTSPVTGYRIQWSRTGTGGWRDLVANTRTTSQHTGLEPNTTRYYRVAAISAAGTSVWSNVADATTDDLTVPGAPRSLRVSPNGLRGSTELRLSWTAPASNGGSPITGYRIERAATRGGAWIIHVASTGSATTTYTDTGLAPNTMRFYRVRALNDQGHGDPSNVAEGTTNAARPGQPRNLRARATGPTSITLAWEAPASDGGERITGYTVRARGPGDGSWITIVPNTVSTATTFEHTGLRPASAYRYQVAAINRVGAGQWSFETSTSTYPDKPRAPVGLTAREVGTSRIDLSWSAPRNTGGAPILGYRIEGSDDGGGTWRIVRRNTSSRGTTFSDVNLQPATTRHYRVAAINTAGTGPFSNTARATTEATVPGTPRSLDAEADGTSRIELSWRAPTSDGGSRITGYRIEVSEDGGTRWENLVANSHNTRTTHVHTGLEPATRRHYRVSAINRIGVGRASRVVSAITDATVPDAPTGLTATAVSPTQIDLFWLAPAYDGGAPVTGYRIEVSENATAWTDLMVNTGSRATTYSHTGLLPGSTRHYRVSAINRVGVGAPSDTASAATDDPIGRAGRLNTRVLPHVAAAMTSSTVSAIARRVDAVANGMGMERRVETNGLSSMAASLSAPDAGGLGLAQGDRAGLAALFGGTSFTMPLGASDAQQQSATGTQLASWGAGEYHYLGEPGQSALDWKGNMVSAHAGLDVRVGSDILAGVAGSYSSGSFDFTDKSGASPVKGTYGTTMASVHPYMAWFSGGGGTSVWGSAGLGRGDIDVDDEREGFRTTPASLLTGAGGASYQLLTRGAGGVRLKAEGWYGEVTVEGSGQIEEVTLEMQRGKLALELTQGFRTGTGNEMAFVLEGGMRYDNGDAINGTSAEVGGGLRYTNSSLGLTAEGRGRFVISARAGYEEWGLGGTLMFDPAARGQGLSIRLAPSYGNHTSGVNHLWERGVHDAVGGHDLGMAPNVDGEVAYGIAGFHGTPYSGFYLGQGGTRAFSSGMRYELGSGVGLRLEGTRREGTLGAPQHSVGVRGRMRLR